MLLGIIILVLGILLLLESIFPVFNFGLGLYISVTIFVCGLYKIIKEEKTSFFNIFLTVFGLMFSLINLNILPPFLINAVIPMLIILVGVIIIYNSSEFKKPYTNNNKIKRYSAIFSENKVKIKKAECSDIECYTIFGSNTLDLSELELSENINLSVYSIFGETTIITSTKYNIITTSTAIFGENIKKIDDNSNKDKNTIYINSVSVFGGSKIKKHD